MHNENSSQLWRKHCFYIQIVAKTIIKQIWKINENKNYEDNNVIGNIENKENLTENKTKKKVISVKKPQKTRAE